MSAWETNKSKTFGHSDNSYIEAFGATTSRSHGSKSQIKGKGTISLPGLPDISNDLYVEGLRVNLLSISLRVKV